MMETAPSVSEATPLDAGLRALCGIAAYYRIGADPVQLARELALRDREADESDLIRAARMVGLKARLVRKVTAERLAMLPAPAIVRTTSGALMVFGGRNPSGLCRLVDPISHAAHEAPIEDVARDIGGQALLIARRIGGAGVDPRQFGMRWFLPTIWRYRRPLGHVLAASLFVQIFALTTPLFFQVVVDKVLTHRGYETLFVLVGGLVIVGLFDVTLQYLRTYALSHTTNRIDVELGQRLFAHLLRLPVAYFETRSTGQTVARVRELETIRSFLTGQALFSAIDLVFAFVFILVLFAYSWPLTLIVLAGVPFYLLIGFSVRPPLRELVGEKFNRGAASQQFLVETIVGVNTVKAAAVEPIMRAQWEEKLAAYVKTSFAATMLGSGGQLAIQYVSKLTTAALLLFGAKAVIDGELTVGALVAFNMIASQAIQPILRLSQLWQDFQQVQISIERLGDILNATPESSPATRLLPPTPRGAIEFAHVSFRYRPGAPEALKEISLAIRAGETIGIVGPSGSGKSTLTKLIQRLCLPGEGQVLLDGADLSHVDPAWLRSHIGVVLQENLLFNRTIHENIAFANPAMARARVIEIARLAGAEEFIDKLAQGYDTMIEERGANLSGGQRQRIAIARALATNPRILILDEATSALDYDSERIVQRNMRRIVKGRTVIIIAHRLAAVYAAATASSAWRMAGSSKLGRTTSSYAVPAASMLISGASRLGRRRSPHDRNPRGHAGRPGAGRRQARGLARAGAAQDAGGESQRPRIPGAGARDPGNAAVAGPCRIPVDHLRLCLGGPRMGLSRPRRHRRRRAGQVPADRAGQGRRAVGDRQGRRHSRRQWLPRQGGRRADRARPCERRGRCRGRARRTFLRTGGNPAPQGRACCSASAHIRFAAENRLARRRRAGFTRARGAGSRRRSRAIGRDPSLVRRRAGAKDRRAGQARRDHRDPEEPGRDPQGARRHAHEAGRREGPGQGRGHRRDRNAAISDHPAGEAGAGTRFALRRTRSHLPRRRQGRPGLHLR